MDILDQEKRRARNLIWNAAEDYGFEPDFKAYDEEGRADLYWNSVIGIVRRCWGPEALDPLFESFRGDLDEHLYEQLVWLGLENAAYLRESPRRPALPSLRAEYARHVLSLGRGTAGGRQLDILQDAHYRRCLGEEAALGSRDREILDALEFPGDLDGPALADRALGVLETYFGFVPGQASPAEPERRVLKRLFSSQRGNRVHLAAVRGFGYGFGEHTHGPASGDEVPQRRLGDLSPVRSAEALRVYIKSYFGPSLYPEKQVAALERELCVGDHKNCKLYYARGGDDLDRTARGYAGSQRRAALKQMEKNWAAYQADELRHRTTIARLTARIRNAMLAYLQPTAVRAPSGSLEAGRVWRGVYLNDDRVFTKVLQTDPGDLCVDLLLDGSASQTSRQETVAAQGYMIAEALTRCGIPVRVTSFCAISGYTVLTRFRDYGEREQNRQIFHYFTTGCNRDGLAIRALGREMEDAPCEHRLAILLSDAKPNDVIKITSGGALLDYAGEPGVQNTAREVRSLLHRDIAVVCVFTGNDDDLPAAHTIYGRGFARIRYLDQFADTVGTLIQNQIRSL